MLRSHCIALVLSIHTVVFCGSNPVSSTGESGSTCAAAGAESGQKHWWPRCHGTPGAYGYTNLTGPWDLKGTWRWTWHHPEYRVVLGSLLDDAKNVYVTVLDGIRKFSPDGTMLWHYQPPEGFMTKASSILGGFIYGDFQTTIPNPSILGRVMSPHTPAAKMFAVDIQTGKRAWLAPVFEGNTEGDTAYVEAHDGMVIAAYDKQFKVDREGNVRIIAVNASDGSKLWEYVSGDILWNFQATFLGDGTFVTYDVHGGVQRIRMIDGSLVWQAKPNQLNLNFAHNYWLNSSFSDGGVTISPNGNVAYTCANFGTGALGTPGVLHAYQLENGLQVWQQVLPFPCVSWPAVDPTGTFVVVVIGSFAEGGKFNPLGAMAFEAQRGAVKWSFLDMAGLFHSGPKGDPEHFSVRRADRGYGEFRQGCGPASWGAPIIDGKGTVYAANHNGLLYAINDFNGDGLIDKSEYQSFDVEVSSLHCGAGFAPGMMAYPTCDAVHVFQY